MNQIMNYLYPTPIYTTKVESFKTIQEELESKIKLLNFQYKESWGNNHQLSDTTFEQNFLIDYGVDTLVDEIQNHVSRFLKIIKCTKSLDYKIASSWVTKFNQGDYAHVHSHGHHDISGVYYHKVNQDHGSFFFQCPVPQMSSSYVFGHLAQSSCTKPEEGMLLLFPGYFSHGVYANPVVDDRISVSFNISFHKHFS
tara:strand:- start:456 stop:1046 length:591 start_codon:yes stop_codon:yes gene_type:complete